MAQIDLYVDIFNRALVSGLNGGSISLPQLYQSDDPIFRIFPVYPTFAIIPPLYTGVSISGLSLQVAIGQKKGTGGTIYTQQLTWAPSSDPNNPNYFIADLPLNTTAINTALGANASTTDAYFQIVYLQGGVQTTILEVPCTINASVIQSGSIVVPPGLQPASVQYVNATFLSRTINGAITLTNPNTGKSALFYLGDDNTLHCDPIN